MQLKNGKSLETCPRCGYDEYEVSVRIHGRGRYAFKFAGGSGDNTQLHDDLFYTFSRTAFCVNCRLRLGVLAEEK